MIIRLCILTVSLCLPLLAQDTVRGVVFEDRNGDQRRDALEPPVVGALVSNGREVVATDAEGRYTLPLAQDCIVFVIKPSGYAVVQDRDGIARSYRVHKPEGSPALIYPGVAKTEPLPASLDFGLKRQVESNRFQVVLFGDTQPYDQTQVDHLAADIIPEVIGTDAAFGITLGDIVGDKLELFERVNEVIGRIGIPWSYVYGNHDMNFDAKADDHADETFERVYGPTNYAFQHGHAHFVVLDNVVFEPATESRRSGYRGGFDAEAMGFLKAYLAHVPADAPLFIAFHIHLDDKSIDRKAFFAALAGHPRAVSISAHTHVHRKLIFGREDGVVGTDEHIHLNMVTTSGSWWGGAKDERGIPHTRMRDGAPNGWGLLSLDGPRWSLETKAAGAPWSYQMDLWYKPAVTKEELAREELHVNVFNGNERSKVELRVNDRGPWIVLPRVERHDPNYVRLKREETEARDAIVAWALARFDEAIGAGDVSGLRKEFEAAVRGDGTTERAKVALEGQAIEEALRAFDRAAAGKDAPSLRGAFEAKLKDQRAQRALPVPNLPAPEDCTHLWAARLPEDLEVGTHKVTVRTTNMFGRTYEAHRIVRVLP